MKVSNKIGRAARAFVALASVVLLLASAAASTAAQGQTPRIATDVEDKEKPKEKETRQPAQQPRQQNTRRGQGGGPRAAAPINVTIKTDLPQSEIFLRRGSGMQLLGKTDAEGTLTVQLPPGKHEITASRQGARILRQQIKVGPDSNSFTFDLALPKPPPKEDETAAATPTPEETKPAEPVKPPLDFDELVARFTSGKGDAPTADEWKEAHDLKAAALEKEPDNKRLEAQTLLAEGQSAYLRNDYPSAVAVFRRAVIASPDYAAAQYALGNAYLATNQPSKAFDAYGAAVKLDKEMAPAYKGAGDALTRLGRTKEATFYFDRAKGLGQTLPTNTSLTKGRELKNRKRWAEAVREFEDVAAREPSADVFMDIGDCYVGLEQPLSASKAYQKATELDSKNSLAYYKLGELMFGLREYASAMESYERALALDTTGTAFNRAKARARADEAAKKLAQQKR